MDFYEVLERRRTYRDFSDREVSDEVLKRVIGSAFKAPTNDHLRQLEFVVVRSRENIAKVVAPLAKNMAAFKELVFEVDESGDKDKMAMFADAMPKQLAATSEGLGAVFHIPVGDEADKIKEIVKAPEGYEFTCLLTIGYPAKGAFLPKQKEIRIEDRIHANAW